MSNFDLRNAQAGALTGQEDDSHPFVEAEQAPNRYHSITWFFPEEDGVRVELDLDLDVMSVTYFDTEGKEQLIKAGALYNWAVNLYTND